MAEKQLGSSPAFSADIATKGYVDAAVSGAVELTKRTVQTVTSSTTLGSAGDYIVFIGSGGAPTLPTAVGNTGRYSFKNIHTADRTIATTNSQTIDGSTTWTIAPLSTVELVSDGSNWRIF